MSPDLIRTSDSVCFKRYQQQVSLTFSNCHVTQCRFITAKVPCVSFEDDVVLRYEPSGGYAIGSVNVEYVTTFFDRIVC